MSLVIQLAAGTAGLEAVPCSRHSFCWTPPLTPKAGPDKRPGREGASCLHVIRSVLRQPSQGWERAIHQVRRLDPKVTRESLTDSHTLSALFP